MWQQLLNIICIPIFTKNWVGPSSVPPILMQTFCKTGNSCTFKSLFRLFMLQWPLVQFWGESPFCHYFPLFSPNLTLRAKLPPSSPPSRPRKHDLKEDILNILPLLFLHVCLRGAQGKSMDMKHVNIFISFCVHIVIFIQNSGQIFLLNNFSKSSGKEVLANKKGRGWSGLCLFPFNHNIV